MPGHAQEFETAMALALFPENVRPDAMADQGDREPLEATAEQGRLLVDEAVQQVTDHLSGIIEGRIRAPEVTHLP
jgi:creatinine amidohydrolase/Fe(II)-dependent formamide hydrolase-like protein